MTLITYDGFDSYGVAADLENRWALDGLAGWNPATDILFDITGRNGVGKCMRWTENVLGVSTGVDSLTTVIAGAAIWLEGDGTGVNTTGFHLFEFWDVGVKHSVVYLDYATEQLAVKHGGTGTTVASSVKTMHNENWYFIEVKCTVSDSLGAGEYEVRVNGETWISVPATSDVYNNSGRPVVSSVRLGGRFLGGSYRAPRPRWDDCYVLDPAIGIAPYNTFLGDCRVDTIRPNGNGTTSNFVGSDADSVDNYLLVDEQGPDGDTTYLESSNPGDLDLFALESLPVTPSSILAVQPVSVAKKDDAGDRVAKHVVRTGATNYTHADGIYASDQNYLAFGSIWELNPNTGVSWIEADINALEAGIKIDS